MASAREYEMLFKLNAEMGSAFNSTFTKANQQLITMQKELQNLSKTQSNISAYQKQQQAVDATRTKFTNLQQQYDNIQREIQETEGFSADLQNKLLAKQLQLEKTGSALQRNTEKLQQLESELQRAGVNTSDLTRESARLTQQMEKLTREQEETAASAEEYGEEGSNALEAIHEAFAAAGIAAALKEIYDAYMACVNIAGDFEAGMSNVAALSGASAKEMDLLTAKAKELGASTKFTAQEASDAMGYMAMAGWDANEMLSGMDGVLNLAAASGEDLAMVSDIVTDNLTAFGMTAADTAHFSDVLAAAATSSNTSVGIMGETFKMSASVAGALGYSIEDVAVAVGLMANSGTKGSIAGTALKNTFNGLLEGCTLTSAAFGEYDFTAVKADGTMKSFSESIDELRVYFEQMTEAERVNNASMLAGQRGYSGLLAILNATDENYSSLTNSINNCSGAAARMAAIKLDNMKGDLTLMQSAWDGLKVTIGEQFTPEMRNLYSVLTDVLTDVNEFAEENPAIVKAIAAFVGIIGAATAGLGAYAVGAKVAAAASKLLTASIPGVNVIMAVTAGVAALVSGVVALTEAANEGVPSVKELTESAQEMDAVMDDAQETYADTVTSTQAAASVADEYITKLEQMGDYASLAEDEQQEYKATLSMLCHLVPDLAQYIDEETGAIKGGTDALRVNTEEWKRNAMQQAYQDQLIAMHKAHADVLFEKEKNTILLGQAEKELGIAQEKNKAVMTRSSELMNSLIAKHQELGTENAEEAALIEYLSDEYSDLHNEMATTSDEVLTAQRAAAAYQKAIDEDAEAIANAKNEIELAEEAFEKLTGATEEGTEADADAVRGKEDLKSSIDSVYAELQKLSEAYDKAYENAYNSITGQYELWDMADDVVVTSANSINEALSSQISYWQDYNANLSSLQDRTSEIEGLSDLIASFADGSPESVNAIAGMAQATDAELQAMVANWKTLQEEQSLVSESIADIETGLTQASADLANQLQADIEAMDLGEEAIISGKNTIEGYLLGVDSMLPRVAAAFSNVGQAGVDALDETLVIKSPSRLMMNRADMTWAGYIQETEKLEPQLRETMAGAASAGIEAYTEEQMLLISLAPQLMSAISATPSGAAIADAPVVPSVQVVFQIDGNASPETVAALNDYGEDFAARVLDVVANAGQDTRRRSYT